MDHQQYPEPILRGLVRLTCLLLALLLALPNWAYCAQPAKKRHKPAVKAEQKPALSPGELIAPYSALGGMNNATRWQFDPAPAGSAFGQEAGGLPLRFRLGREELRDPLTQKELVPRADPLGARKSMEALDLKGAADKLGGKAEVQVDLLKF